jgi:hypothetical protein
MRRTCTPRPPAAVLALLLGSLFACAGPAFAQAPISAARYIAPPGYRTKEFTLVRTDAWFHIFYIRENLIVGAPTERSLGHAISRDLYTWTEQDTILPVIEGTFEGSQIWAPHLMKSDGLWRLFYPAMREDPANGYHLAQTMTSATSPDLYTWTRRETPLFDNSIFPWAYHDTTVALGMDCRDPFIWWDEVHGEWLMYVATRPASQPTAMAIGILGSSDLETWSDRGLVPLTLPAVSFSPVAESPLILRRDATPLLFMWTTNSGQSLTYGTSNDPVTGWTNSRRLRTMLGYTTTGWWAAETLVDGPRHYFGSVHDTWIDFWDMVWTSNEAFLLLAPDKAQAISASFDRAGALPGDSVRVELATVGSVGRRLDLEWVRIRGTYVDTLNAADWGLPDSVTVGPDSAAAWFAVSPFLGEGRSCLLSVAVANAGATLPPDTLGIGVAEIVYQDPPELPEPIIGQFFPVFRPRFRKVEFSRAPGTAAWTVDVYDVRGRLCWSGRGAAHENVLEWHVGGARAGVYFARARAGNGAPARGKFVIY